LDNSVSIEQTITQARQRLELGYWQEALQLFKQAAEEAETEAKRALLADLEIGKLYLALGQPEQAEEPLSRAGQALPENAQVHYLLGNAHRRLEQWDKAAAALERADQLVPSDPAILADLGWVVFQRGDRKRGKQLVEQALRLDLGRIPTALDLALIYADEGNLQAAIVCAQRAYQLTLGGIEAREVLDLLYALRDQIGVAEPATRRKPRSEQEWRELISLTDRPTDLAQSAADVFQPRDVEELQRHLDRILGWWNTTPRPELGGLSPEEVSKQQPRQSKVEPSPTPRWLKLDPGVATENILRRNMVAFLSHLGDVKYTATSSRGNLPLKAMYAINELLVEPVKLEDRIGDHVYKPRSAQDVRTFDFLQALAMTGDLARFEPGRRITLTDGGHDFLASAPVRQVWALFYTWWWRTNWLYVYPWQSFEEDAMDILPRLAQGMLSSIPPGEWIPMGDFIRDMLDTGGLEELAETSNKSLLNNALERMVLHVPEDFDAVEIKRKPRQSGKMTLDEPVAFRVTPFGQQFLRAL
jgi:tetratricopeptide (TPR) repeat protein